MLSAKVVKEIKKDYQKRNYGLKKEWSEEELFFLCTSPADLNFCMNRLNRKSGGIRFTWEQIWKLIAKDANIVLGFDVSPKMLQVYNDCKNKNLIHQSHYLKVLKKTSKKIEILEMIDKVTAEKLLNKEEKFDKIAKIIEEKNNKR